MAQKTFPQHIAVIMDGNRRWARKKGLPQFEGHRRGYKRCQEMVSICQELGIASCSFWAFSTENWKRDHKEVDYLMRLLEDKLSEELEGFMERNIRFRHLGRKDRVPKTVRELLERAEESTKRNTGLLLNFCIDYGGRDEILRAVKKACEAGKTDWTEADFSLLLDTAGSADPDLIIRTSGEQRLSGFLLWQCSYSELYFTETCFPDFDREAFMKALESYAQRNRTKGA